MFCVSGYLPGSKERKELESALKEVAGNVEDVPIVIGDEEIRTKNVRHQVMVSYVASKTLYMHKYINVFSINKLF